jgi:hypothetical protein
MRRLARWTLNAISVLSLVLRALCPTCPKVMAARNAIPLRASRRHHNGSRRIRKKPLVEIVAHGTINAGAIRLRLYPRVEAIPAVNSPAAPTTMQNAPQGMSPRWHLPRSYPHAATAGENRTLK